MTAQTPSEETFDPHYAGFFRRLVAYSIDGFLFYALVIFFVQSVSQEMRLRFLEALIRYDSLVTTGAYLAVVLAFWLTCQATPGKMIVGVKIVDADSGDKPTFWQYLRRLIGYFLSALSLGLGYLWAIFDSRKQGWHDKLANTSVVRTSGSVDQTD